MKILFLGIVIRGAMMQRCVRQPNRFTQLVKKAFSEHEIIEEGLCGQNIVLK